MTDRVKAFLNKLINDERRWTSELEEEARAIVADIEGAAASAIGAVQTAAGASAMNLQLQMAQAQGALNQASAFGASQAQPEPKAE